MALQDVDTARDSFIDRGLGGSGLSEQYIKRGNIEETRALASSLRTAQATMEEEKSRRGQELLAEYYKSQAETRKALQTNPEFGVSSGRGGGFEGDGQLGENVSGYLDTQLNPEGQLANPTLLTNFGFSPTLDFLGQPGSKGLRDRLANTVVAVPYFLSDEEIQRIKSTLPPTAQVVRTNAQPEQLGFKRPNTPPSAYIPTSSTLSSMNKAIAPKQEAANLVEINKLSSGQPQTFNLEALDHNSRADVINSSISNLRASNSVVYQAYLKAASRGQGAQFLQEAIRLGVAKPNTSKFSRSK